MANYGPVLNYKDLPPYEGIGAAYTWLETWRLILTKPSTESFEKILGDPQKSTSRATTWIVATGIFTSVVVLGLIIMTGLLMDNHAILHQLETPETTYLYEKTLDNGMTLSIYRPDFFATMRGTNVMMRPIGLVIDFLITAVVIHLSARILRGKGAMNDYMYAYASYTAPLTLLTTLSFLIPSIGIFLAGCLRVYTFVLDVIAIKSVYHLGWGRAILTFFIPLIFILSAFFSLVALASLLAG